MLYHYLAADKSGKILEDDFEADNLSQLLQYLAGKELKPVSVKTLKTARAGGRISAGKITISDKVFLTKYLALMLRVGTDLLSAIDILIADFDKPSMKNFLLEVRDNLSHGQPFYQAFARYPRVFSPVFISLVKAAEASGTLQKTFEDLSVSLIREADLKNNIRSSLVYPIILLLLSFVIFTFLSTFALPKIAKVFTDAAIEPPFFSKVVFGVGLFFGKNIFVIMSAILLIVGFSVYFFSKTGVGRHMAQAFFSQLPLVRRIYRELALERFASAMSSLMKAGLPIIQTIRITAEIVGEEAFRLSLLRIGEEGLSRGLTIGEAFRREVVFPKVVTNLIAISEKAGHLEDVLATLAEFYASGIEARIKVLVSVLEPILLLIMGVLVAVIALSIIVPIYQLTTQL